MKCIQIHSTFVASMNLNAAAYQVLIRLKQMLREVYAAGLLGVLCSVLGLGFGGYVWLKALPDGPFWVGAIPLLLLLSVHFGRTDHHFMKVWRGKQKPFFLAIEYLFFAAPFWLSAGIHTPWFLLIYPAFIAALVFLPVGSPRVIRPFFNLRFIPDSLYEIKSGIRKSTLLWLFLFLLSLLGFLHLAAPIVAWVLLLLCLPEFYREAEPWPLLVLKAQTPSRLLLSKWVNHSAFFLLFSLPSVLVFMVFQTPIWWLALVFVGLLLFNLFFNLVCKYAYYESAALQSANQIWLSTGLVCLFFPPLLPLPFVMSVVFYRKSLKKLAPYLHD